MKIDVSPAALADIDRLYAWLAGKNPAAARRAVMAIIATIDSLDQMPERGYEVLPAVRQLRVQFGKRGYVVRYSVLPNEIRITRVFHAREDR